MVCRHGHRLTSKNAYVYTRKSDGNQIVACRRCRAAASHKWRVKHPEYDKHYHDTHPDYYRNYAAKRRLCRQ